GNSIQLMMASDVTFTTGQAAIRSNFYPALNSVAIVVKKYDNNMVYIRGYTDNVGGVAYNQRLSGERAQSVGQYLISQGVASKRIYTEGRGESQPVASNATAEGRAMNRRVVITLQPKS
ncbi:MAG TPA: OmpA family protein, partial [Gammaproteobacteria bacterium]|nr:OmpA family protein [Gammaproteobacteria bacterium]